MFNNDYGESRGLTQLLRAGAWAVPVGSGGNLHAQQGDVAYPEAAAGSTPRLTSLLRECSLKTLENE